MVAIVMMRFRRWGCMHVRQTGPQGQQDRDQSG